MFSAIFTDMQPLDKAFHIKDLARDTKTSEWQSLSITFPFRFENCNLLIAVGCNSNFKINKVWQYLIGIYLLYVFFGNCSFQ
jgi:hypothetical protein